jgi:hypothetical protein
VLWKHRNDCVFNGANPNIQLVIRTFLEEAYLWSLADAKGSAFRSGRYLDGLVMCKHLCL